MGDQKVHLRQLKNVSNQCPTLYCVQTQHHKGNISSILSFPLLVSCVVTNLLELLTIRFDQIVFAI